MRLLSIVLALAFVSPALAQNHTYSSPGSYTLPAESTSTGTFNVKITASNVTLDLGGHTVRCNPPDPGSATTFGVYASGTSNVTIKNGSITGCFMGVNAGSSTDLRVENVDFTGNTYIGVNNAYGTGGVVIDSTFADITGYDNEAYAIGINGVGSNALVEGNTCSSLHRQKGVAPQKVGEGVCILVSVGMTNVTIRNNTISNYIIEDDIGIWLGSGGGGHKVMNNMISGFPTGIVAAQQTDMIAIGNELSLSSSFAGSVGIRGNAGFAIGNMISGYETEIEGNIAVRKNR